MIVWRTPDLGRRGRPKKDLDSGMGKQIEWGGVSVFESEEKGGRYMVGEEEREIRYLVYPTSVWLVTGMLPHSSPPPPL